MAGINDAKEYQRKTGCSWDDALDAIELGDSEPIPAGLLVDNFEPAEFACDKVRKKILDGNEVSAKLDDKELDDDELYDKLKSMGLPAPDIESYIKAKSDGSGIAIKILLCSLPPTDQLYQTVGLYMALDSQEDGGSPEAFNEGIITAMDYREALESSATDVDKLNRHKTSVEKEFKRLFSGDSRKYYRSIFRGFLDDYIVKVHDQKMAERNR